MLIDFKELKEIERVAYQEGTEAAMDEVVRQLPAMIDEAVKIAIEAHKAAPAKRGTRPTYPSARRSSSKPTLRPVN
jgi:hypothetical protein